MVLLSAKYQYRQIMTLSQCTTMNDVETMRTSGATPYAPSLLGTRAQI